jgi:hypothetical protein
MSNYKAKAINPATGEVDEVMCIDDYYGNHRYAVEFPDGDIYHFEDIEFVKEADGE